MIENVLVKRNASLKTKITVKTLISAAVIALAIILPQIVHAVAGASGGVKWLPMYLPVLIGGCLLGWKWGLAVGVLSPLTSFAITSMFGDPMPAAARLPYMIIELAVFAGITGLFSEKISRNPWTAFAAVLFAAVGGRLVFLAVAAIFQSVSPLSAVAAWSQIQNGLFGLLLQITIVPVVVTGLSLAVKYEKL